VSLRFEDVSFQYGPRYPWRPARSVFSHFNWEAPAGRTVLLGPNGAGKTTLLSLAATSLQPQAGEIRFNGLSASRDERALREVVGLMPQAVLPIPGLTAQEQVAYAGWLQGLDRGSAASGASAALSRVGLQTEAGTLVSSLSGGQRRRVGLAQVLVRSAELLLLDEPSAGLDPAQRSQFRDLVAGLPSEVQVLISTHQVDDLSDLFDTVVVLDGGAVRYQGSPAQFMALAPSGSPRPAEAAYLTLLSGGR